MPPPALLHGPAAAAAVAAAAAALAAAALAALAAAALAAAAALTAAAALAAQQTRSSAFADGPAVFLGHCLFGYQWIPTRCFEIAVWELPV
jgi:hypothetical protein